MTTRLQVHFQIDEANRADFERLYAERYAPALRRQHGYLRSSLLRVYPTAVLEAFGGAPTRYNYQLELDFDTEDNRRRWVASPDHDPVWTAATALASDASATGFDVVASDLGDDGAAR
jgi:heme-degrading monooxygenase HmoA